MDDFPLKKQNIFNNLGSSIEKRETLKFYDKGEWLLYVPPGLTFRNPHSTRSEFLCFNRIYIYIYNYTG
jgi:hypothetical protein